MRLDRLITLFISSFALLPSIKCSSPLALAVDGSIGNLGSSDSTTAVRRPRGTAPNQRGTHEQTHNENQSRDYARNCYREPLPYMLASRENRTVPWGGPGMGDGDGRKSCCSTLEEVRQGIDAVDKQLLELLAQRAAYVREATRFKATHDTVDVPPRDRQVIEQAVEDAPQYHLPRVIARGVFSAIINASVNFELCVFDSYEGLTQVTQP